MLADKAADKQAAALKKLHKALTDGGVIGDVLPELWLPLITVEAKFPAGKKVVAGKEVSVMSFCFPMALDSLKEETENSEAAFCPLSDCHEHSKERPTNQKSVIFCHLLHNQIPLAATLSLPSVSLTLPNPSAYHTVLITDPDVPSRSDPHLGERRYLCVANIPGEALAAGDLTKGEWLQDWEAPSPEPGSGLHRFVLVVYEQPGAEKIEMSVFDSRDGRNQFGSYKWAEGFGMKAIGANFWQAQEK